MLLNSSVFIVLKFLFLLQPSVDDSVQKDGRAKPPVRPMEGPSQLSKEKTVEAPKKCDVSASKSIPVQEEKPHPHRPTNFFDRLSLPFNIY